MGHGSGRGSHRTPFSHQNTCRHVNPPSMWISDPCGFQIRAIPPGLRCRQRSQHIRAWLSLTFGLRRWHQAQPDLLLQLLLGFSPCLAP